MKHWIVLASAVAAFVPLASAQQNQRRATIVGGGDRDHGKCTIEVIVDGAADVEIRGDVANIRNLSGQPAQWRRFECTGPVPANASDFRFSGVDGRGRQELVRDPRNGGATVVRIEDPNGGSEGYTFDITWGGNFNYQGGDYRGGGYPGNTVPSNRYPGEAYPGNAYPGGGQRPYDNHDRNPGRRFTTSQAIGVCQDAVREQARDRFRGRNVEFRDTRIDDNPGRNDWVVGRIDVFRGRHVEDRMRFSCSVNFDTGRVRSVDVQPERR